MGNWGKVAETRQIFDRLIATRRYAREPMYEQVFHSVQLCHHLFESAEKSPPAVVRAHGAFERRDRVRAIGSRTQ